MFITFALLRRALRFAFCRAVSSYEHLSLSFVSTLRGSGTLQGNTLSEKLIGHIIRPGDAMIYWLGQEKNHRA
jgi:hypothetical protein